MPRVHNSPASRFGSDFVKRNFLAPSIAGDYVACLGVSEVSYHAHANEDNAVCMLV